MIDLTDAVGQRVHLQLKRALCFVGAHEGRLGPLPDGAPRKGPDGQIDPTAPPPKPMIIDQISGKLRMVEVGVTRQFVLTYPNPVNPSESIDMYLDLENVACAWVLKTVVMATPNDLHNVGG